MSYSHVATITIDHTKIPNTDLTNFVVRIVGTVADFKSVANGGKMQTANDVNWFTDAGLTTPAKFQKVVLNQTTGAHEFFVRAPTASHTVDTLLYCGIGDASVTVDQSDSATWDANFSAVYNFGDGTAFDGTDWTGNGNTLTNAGLTAAADNSVGGAVVNSGTNKATRNGSLTNWVATAGVAQIEALFWPDDVLGSKTVFACGTSGGSSTTIYEMRTNAATVRAFYVAALATSVATITAAAWNYCVAKFSAANARSIMVNGNTPTTNATNTSTANPADHASVMCNFAGASTFNNPLVGKCGHVRVSKIARSDDWNVATTNSVLNPSTFYSMGAFTATGAGSVVPQIMNLHRQRRA